MANIKSIIKAKNILAEAINTLSRLGNKHYPLPEQAEIEAIFKRLNESCQPEDIVADIVENDDYLKNKHLYILPIKGILDAVYGVGCLKVDGETFDFWDGMTDKMNELGWSEEKVLGYSEVVRKITHFLSEFSRCLKTDFKDVGIFSEEQPEQQPPKQEYSEELLELFKGSTGLIDELIGLTDNEVAKKIRGWAKERDKFGKPLIENPKNNLKSKFARELKKAGLIRKTAEEFRKDL